MAIQNIIVEGLLSEGKCFNVAVGEPISVYHLKQRIYAKKLYKAKVLYISPEGSLVDGLLQLIHPRDYFLTSNGICLEEGEDIITRSQCPIMILRAHPLLMGGKGGFGTLIRAMGTQINKGARKGACRDLSGRRMRDVDAEKKLAEWVAKEPERRKKSAEEKRKKLEKRRSEPKHHFNDTSYMDQIRSTEENIDTALQQGLQAAASSTSTKKIIPESSGNRVTKIWVGIDDSSDESDDNGDDNSESHTELKKRKLDTSSDDNSECHTELKKRKLADTNSDENSGCHTEMRKRDDLVKLGKEDCCVTPIEKSAVYDESRGSSLVDTDCSGTGSSEVQQVIDVNEFTLDELMSIGGNVLKYTLQSMGLKCGGTVTERAERLFSTKGKSKAEIDRSLFAKNRKWKTKKI